MDACAAGAQGLAHRQERARGRGRRCRGCGLCAPPDQAEQLEGHRPQVFAQKAFGYWAETMLIQLLSHLPYFFCWSHEYVVSGDWSAQGHFPLLDELPAGLGEPARNGMP